MKLGLFILKDIPRLTFTLSKLNDLLHQYEHDLLGVEYLAFFHDSEKDNFGCLLCTKFKKGSLQNMMNHFKSKLHCTSFLQKHFPNVYERLSKMEIDVKPSEEEFRSLLRSSISEITNRCPEEHPIALSINDAIACKIEVTRAIFEASKSKEKATDTLCIDLIRQIKIFGDMIQQKRHKLLSKQESIALSKSINSNEDSSDGEIFDNMESIIEAGRQKPNETKRQRTVSPVCRRRSPSLEPSVKRLISKYKYRYNEAMQKLESEYKNYKTVPDTHPNYKSEWDCYWIKRISMNPFVDCNSLDFVEDWKNFFKVRLQELEQEDQLKTRVRIKKDLRLPIDFDDMERLERILSSESNDKKIVQNFNYDEVVRRYSPKRKRASIDVNEIEEEFNSIKTTEDRPLVKKTKIYKPYISSRDPRIVKNLKTTSDRIAQTSTDGNNNEIADKNNQRGNNPDEGEKILIMEAKELILLYKHYDDLTDEIKSQLTAYMEELRKTDPAKYEIIIHQELTASIAPKIEMSDDDEYNDEELMKTFSKM